MPRPSQNNEPQDFRRPLLFVLTIAFAAIGLGTWWLGDSSTSKVIAGGSGRVALLLGALWLAWPSLRRPADWLPSGMAFACVAGLAVLAAQPRLIVAVIPALAALLVVSAFVRGSRGPKR